MGWNDIGDDWEACGVAGGAITPMIGGSLGIWEFRSRDADIRASILFAAVGFGLGIDGSLGGGAGPSPGDVIHNQMPNLWSSLNCQRKFALHDLDWTTGQMSVLAASPMYGYQSVSIAAGSYPVLFSASDASGWSPGVALSAQAFWGIWKNLSYTAYW